MKTNNGFVLQTSQNVPEVNGTASVYVHEKTGAQLIHIANSDIEKSFCATFRTLPTDSTGVAHILEHSVLAGSKKYPVKEPFVELMKGSLNSFINAMTFPDRTGYPFASPNEKDFFNVLDVYLDAVFNPTIYTTDETFMQEGWHYEFDAEDNLIVNGVVYNEMKGAMSSPSRQLFEIIGNSLFDNVYSYNSGGAPEVIPTLTKEQFKQFHSTYYHPSNCLMCVYGDISIDKVLKFINDNYLSKYDKLGKDISVSLQAPIGSREIVEYYGISDNDTEENKTYFAKSCVMDTIHNSELTLAMEILNKILLGTEASPLKRALLSAGVGQNVRGSVENEILQPFFSVIVDNANVEDKDKFLQVYNDTLTSLVKNGIDKELIEASVSSIEFILREGPSYGYPKGVLYAISSSCPWLFGDNPIDGLLYEKKIESIKSKMNNGYFESIIEKYLLSSQHSSLVMLAPKKGVLQEKEEKQKAKFAEIKKGLTAEEITQIKEDAAKLLKRQQNPDSPEALATMPRLSISDIDVKPQTMKVVEKKIGKVKAVHNPLFTSGIGYTNLYFDITNLSMEEVQYAQLLAFMFDKLGTKNYTFEQLSNQINICSGGISASCSVHTDINTKKCTPYFMVKSSAVSSKLSQTCKLINEMLTQIDLTDKNRLSQLLQTAYAQSQMFLQNAGHVVALYRQKSYFMQEGQYQDATAGLGYALFIKKLMAESQSIDVVAMLKAVCEKIFNKANLFVYFAGEDKDYNILVDSFDSLTVNLPDKSSKAKPLAFVPNSANQGIASQSMVQYVCKGGSYADEGFDYNGSIVVVKNMLHSGYLWNSLRVQGGAYGIIPDFSAAGYIQEVSYRDPHLTRTIDVLNKIGEYLATTPIDQAELDMQIIAAVGEVDAPRLPKMKAAIEINSYLSGINNDFLAKRKQQIMSTTIEDIRKFADLFNAVMNKNSLCVYGNNQKINDAKDEFNEIITL